MTISNDSVVVAVDSQISSEVDAETVILDFNNGSYFGLDEVGTVIWRALQQPQAVSAVCDAVMEEFDVTRTTCEQDVMCLLDALHEKGLIKVRGGPTR